LFAAAIEGARYRLAKDLIAALEKKWHDSIKGRCRSRAAGEMARIVAAYWLSKVDYPRRMVHTRAVMDYLRRSSKVKWQGDDLRNVCIFLGEMFGAFRDAGKLHDQYVTKGERYFPDMPRFHFERAKSEFLKGPFLCDRLFARKRLERALQLIEKGHGPEDHDIVEPAKRLLSLMGDEPDSPFGRFGRAKPFRGPMPFPFTPGDLPDDAGDEAAGDPGDFGKFMEDILNDVAAKMNLDPQDILDEIQGMGPRLDGEEDSRSPGRGRKKKHRK
jgi:hypothetical protein